MRYGSVCSGMEAATCAWHPLGWEPVFFSEIERNPSRFLAAKYPQVPNRGDMTKFMEWPDEPIDLLVGGTPCQSFSIAGLRKGLADPRGNLMLTYLGIADRYRPRWLVWENVPGVLSSNGGRDFGTLLGGLGQLGYGFAYRVLDAQYVRVESHARAVPQRRRRVFLVGYLGDWRRAAAVLFDRESLSGNSPPRRATGQGLTHDVAPSLTSSGRGVERNGETRGQDPVIGVQAFGGNNQRRALEVSTAVRAKGGTGHGDFESETFVAHTLDASYGRLQGASGQDAKHGHSHLVPVPGLTTWNADVAVSHALKAEGHDASEDGTGRGVPLAFRTTGNDGCYERGPIVGALNTATDPNQNILLQRYGWAVRLRRLTPLECLRLQGFPDDYFDSARMNKPLADGPMYKMLGNSMAVNVMSWIGRRIALVDAIPKLEAVA